MFLLLVASLCEEETAAVSSLRPLQSEAVALVLVLQSQVVFFLKLCLERSSVTENGVAGPDKARGGYSAKESTKRFRTRMFRVEGKCR